MDARLNGLEGAAIEKKLFVEKHCERVEGVTNEAKRKWEEFAAQTQHDSVDGSDFSATKHCRLESFLQQWYVHFLFSFPTLTKPYIYLFESHAMGFIS